MGQRDPEVGLGFLRGGARPPTPVVVDFIDRYKREFGVEPICRTLTTAGTEIAPSTYCAAATGQPSKREVRDARLLVEVRRVHAQHYGVYGVRKVHARLRREGIDAAWCTVERLMRADGLRGVSRAMGPRATVPGKGSEHRPGLVERDFPPRKRQVPPLPRPRTSSGWQTSLIAALSRGGCTPCS